MTGQLSDSSAWIRGTSRDTRTEKSCNSPRASGPIGLGAGMLQEGTLHAEDKKYVFATSRFGIGFKI